MSKEIAKRQSFKIDGRERSVSITTPDLISHGCKHCIWKLHNQCPNGITEPGKFHTFKIKGVDYPGYCEDYINFILSFAEGSESISAIWEKYAMYNVRIQSLEDYDDYKRLKDELGTMRAEGKDYKEIARMAVRVEEARLYWERVMETMRKGYGRIADRESKSRDASRSPPSMNAKVINFYPEKKND